MTVEKVLSEELTKDVGRSRKEYVMVPEKFEGMYQTSLETSNLCLFFQTL